MLDRVVQEEGRDNPLEAEEPNSNSSNRRAILITGSYSITTPTNR